MGKLSSRIIQNIYKQANQHFYQARTVAFPLSVDGRNDFRDFRENRETG